MTFDLQAARAIRAQIVSSCAYGTLTIVAMLVFAAIAYTQTTTGTISGTVIDQSGNIVPAARVSVTNQANGDVRRTETSSAGDFSFPSLLPATYTVQVEVQGFQTYRSNGNTLTPNGRLALGEIRLSLGSVNETVQVTAQSAQVSTESAENSGELTRDQFSMVPTKGRDLTNMLRLLPGVQMTGDQDSFGGATGFGATMGAAEGVRNDSQNLTVDGIVANDMGAPAGLSGQLNMDAVQEVKVLLSNYQAEYGRNPGANISMTTRAGTTEFHGGAYWYARNDFFNANDFFRNQSPSHSLNAGPAIYRFNTWGATFGGPVPFRVPKLNSHRGDKLFFFYSYDQTADRVPSTANGGIGGLAAPAVTRYNQPTALERAGNFSQSAVQPIDPVTHSPFPNGIIPASRVNPIGQALMNLYPLPNVPNNGSWNYEIVPILSIPNFQHVFRVDEKLNSNDSLYFRGSIWHKDTHGPGGTVGYGSTPLWPFLDSHYQYYDDSMALNYTHIWNPRIVSEFTVGARHSTERENKDDFNALKQKGTRAGLGLNIPYVFGAPHDNPFDLIPNITYTNVVNPTLVGFGTRFGIPGSDVQFNITHATTFVFKSHSFKVGIFWDRGRDIEGRTGATNGAFDFGTNPTNPLNSANPFANQLLGNFFQYTEANTRIPLLQFRYVVDWYVQDTWKVTKKLTLDYGIRFDYSSWFHQNNLKSSNFDPTQYNRANTPRQYVPDTAHCGARSGYDPVTGQCVSAALISAFVPGTGSVSNGLVLQTDPGVPLGFIKQPGVLVMPRLGIAYDPFGDGKTAIRTGAGVFYQTEDDGVNFGNAQVQNPPQILTASVFNSNISQLQPGSGFTFPANIGGLDLRTTRPVVYNYDFGIQRDLGKGLLADVKYVGGLSRHLTGKTDLNTLPLGARFANPDPTNPGSFLVDNLIRPYPGYGSILYMQRNISSNYNALQATLNRRYTHGFQFGLAYTYSKSMDYDSNTRPTGNACCLSPLYLSQRRNYGESDFDQTHVMTANWQYDIPGLTSGHKLVSGVTSGWQVSGVGSFSTGTPLSITGTSLVMAVDTVGGGDQQRVNILCNPNYGHYDRSPTNWFNASCIGYPGATLGNAGRQVIRGPGRTNFDLTLFRNFNLGNEKRVLTFRWEAYNVFNHTQFTIVDTTARFNAAGVQTNPTFGQAIGASPARQMQFSLRLRY
jgi:outer membrane receptor protein involved in Fe transport